MGTRVSVGGNDPNPNQPQTSNYTLTIQRRLPWNFVVEADYLGYHSVHLYTQTDVNRFAGNLIQNGSLTRLNPYFGSIIYGQAIGSARANVFSFALARRFARGWSAQAIYSKGRAVDAVSSNDNGIGNAQHHRRFEHQRAVGPRGLRRAEPAGAGRRMGGAESVPLDDPEEHGGQLAHLGHRHLPKRAALQRVYFRELSGRRLQRRGFNYDLPNTPSFGNYVSASRSNFLTGVFKASDFPTPTKGQEGNLGRNTFEGPGLANVNLNAIKAIHIPWFIGQEGATLEIRGEFANLLNRVNLTQPTSDLASGLFGKSTGQRQTRTVQLGLRIAF